MGYFEVFAGALAGFYALIPSYGLAIILLTLVTRVILLPLSIKQTRSMREMQKIQPELAKLRAKHKGDRQKLNEEQMLLFKEHGVNPFGGCGPLVLQMPVLFGLFYVIRQPLKYMGYKATEVAGGALNFVPGKVEGFMATIHDSALANALFKHPLPVHNFLGLRLDCSSSLALRGDGTPILSEACGSGLITALPYLILVVLMGLTTFYQQKQMQAKQGAQAQDSPMAQQMQMFTKVMPAMLMVFSFSFPSGLVIYWLTTNLWTIVQQRIILKAVPLAPGAKAAPAGNGSRSAKPSKAQPTPPASKPGGGTKPREGAKGSNSTSKRSATGQAGNGAGSKPRSGDRKKRKR
jgi:YidC/Oxa1 family membrane protein insertase